MELGLDKCWEHTSEAKPTLQHYSEAFPKPSDLCASVRSQTATKTSWELQDKWGNGQQQNTADMGSHTGLTWESSTRSRTARGAGSGVSCGTETLRWDPPRGRDEPKGRGDCSWAGDRAVTGRFGVVDTTRALKL